MLPILLDLRLVHDTYNKCRMVYRISVSSNLCYIFLIAIIKIVINLFHFTLKLTADEKCSILRGGYS